jgi:hypothetical protein
MKLSSELFRDRPRWLQDAGDGRRCLEIGELCLSQIFFQDEQRTPWSQEDLDAMF